MNIRTFKLIARSSNFFAVILQYFIDHHA